MVTIGILILLTCLLIRGLKLMVTPRSLPWALMSITYTIGIHVGIVLVIWGLWKG